MCWEMFILFFFYYLYYNTFNLRHAASQRRNTMKSLFTFRLYVSFVTALFPCALLYLLLLSLSFLCNWHVLRGKFVTTFHSVSFPRISHSFVDFFFVLFTWFRLKWRITIHFIYNFYFLFVVRDSLDHCSQFFSPSYIHTHKKLEKILLCVIAL